MTGLVLRAVPWVSRLALQLSLGGMLVAVSPNHAVAQTAEETAAARDLARQGAAAFAAEDWQRAYDFFQRAESLFHAPPHLLYMARSKAKLGAVVEALELYNKIVRERLEAGAPPAFVDAQKSAAEEMKELEPLLARVTVTLEGPGADGAEVFANGKPVPAALLGVPRPVDPGSYEFTVTAEGGQAEPVVIMLDPGAQETVVLRLSAIEESPLPPPPVTTPADSARNPAAIPAYLALGVGAVGLGLGTYFLINHLDQKGDADDLFEARDCARDGACTVEEQQQIKGLSSDAATSGTLSIVSYGVGVAAIGAGLFLLLTNDSSPAEAARLEQPHVRPVLGWRSVGLTGRF